MALTTTEFIPQLWSARFLANLHKNLVYGNIANKDYEGDLKYGSKVRISHIGPITISDYSTTTGVEDVEDVKGDGTWLEITEQKSFNFKVEDIVAVQSNAKLVDEAMGEAAYAMGDEIDQFIAGHYTDAGLTLGDDTTPVEVDVTNAYDLLVDVGVQLDENNVPSAGRYIVLPPWYLGMLAKDPRFTKEPRVLANGVVEGQTVARMQLYMSNNVPHTTGTKYKILAGINRAIAYAGQISKIEPYRPEKFFADAVKGLFVYGAEVIDPDAVLCMTANKA